MFIKHLLTIGHFLKDSLRRLFIDLFFCYFNFTFNNPYSYKILSVGFSFYRWLSWVFFLQGKNDKVSTSVADLIKVFFL